MAKMRVIDHGTRYDIKGNLRRFVRRIESGDLQDATDVIVITRKLRSPGGLRSVELFHFGTGEIEHAHWMLATAKNRIEPA